MVHSFMVLNLLEDEVNSPHFFGIQLDIKAVGLLKPNQSTSSLAENLSESELRIYKETGCDPKVCLAKGE